VVGLDLHGHDRIVLKVENQPGGSPPPLEATV